MLWADPWMSLLPTLLVVLALVAWLFAERKNARLNTVAAAGLVLVCWVVAPAWSRNVSVALYTSLVDLVVAVASRLPSLVSSNAEFRMLLMGAAVVWCVVRRRLPAVLSAILSAILSLPQPLTRPRSHSLSVQAPATSVADPVEACSRAHPDPRRRSAPSARRVACRNQRRCRHHQLDPPPAKPPRPEAPDPSQRRHR